MRVFLTGATGFIGTAIVPQLIASGHQVLGLTRSDAGAKALRAAGAEPHHGTLEDLDSLRSGAAAADGIIHCAFDHDFSNFVANCEKDRRVIEAMGSVLAGSDRPFVITSGTGLGTSKPGEPAVEDYFAAGYPNPRIASELAGNALLERGVNVSVMRLPQVHDPYKQGLITYCVAAARDKGISAYIGEGANRWPACPVADTARAYVLALEKAERGARYHAVAEEGVTAKAIAESLGRGLKLPAVSITQEQAGAHFGWMAMFASLDMPASSKLTQERLNWHPTGPSLISDLDQALFV